MSSSTPAFLRSTTGPWGYGGWAFRVVTHLFSCWLLGLPAWALLRLLWKVRVFGAERIWELDPPFLIVSNHQSMIDSHVFCLAYGLMPRGLFNGRLAPFHTPEARNFMGSRLSAWLHTALRCVPVTRGAGVHQPGLNTVIEILRRGNNVYMFPEGTRTRDGQLGPGLPGVGRVALHAGCPVLPVHLDGLREVLPIGRRWPRLFLPITVRVGQPISPDRWAGVPDDNDGWTQIADDLMSAIGEIDPAQTGAETAPNPGQERPGP